MEVEAEEEEERGGGEGRRRRQTIGRTIRGEGRREETHIKPLREWTNLLLQVTHHSLQCLPVDLWQPLDERLHLVEQLLVARGLNG